MLYTGMVEIMTPKGMSVQEAYRLYRDGNLLVNRKYQRKLVWTETEKIDLIDTISKGFPIPLILFAERSQLHGSGKYEILDGVQRLNAIFSFIENSFPINGNYFDINQLARAKQLADQDIFKVADDSAAKLDAKLCANLLDYQLAVTIFPAFNEAQITEIFGRINSRGRQLSDQERRQAGVINTFGEFVRKISAEIRGDASKNILLLSEMPEISIESTRARQSYGLTADDIFWVRQGILSNKQLRESQDEEIFADLIVSILVNQPFARSKEKLDELYDANSELYKRVENALISYSQEKLYDEIKQVFSIIREIIEEYDPKPNALRNIVAPKSGNPIKASFYATFMAFYDLLVRKNKSPTDSNGIIEELKNHQLDMITGAHYTRPEDRERNINKTIGLIQKYFVYKEPPILKHGPGLALDFENSLRRSRIETPRYEFKQGLLSLVDNPTLNKDLLNRIINTICGIANLGPDSEGYIYLGVADKKSDAERIKELYGIEYFTISDRYVVGIEREVKQMKLTTERYLEKIVDHIRISGLSDPLKTQVLTQIDIVNFKNYNIIRIKVPTQSQLSFVGNDAYARKGSSTNKIEGRELVSVNYLFDTQKTDI